MGDSAMNMSFGSGGSHSNMGFKLIYKEDSKSGFGGTMVHELTHRLMTRGFSRQGAAELLHGSSITHASDRRGPTPALRK